MGVTEEESDMQEEKESNSEITEPGRSILHAMSFSSPAEAKHTSNNESTHRHTQAVPLLYLDDVFFKYKLHPLDNSKPERDFYRC